MEEDQGFKVILDCVANLRPPRATEIAVFKNRFLSLQEGNHTKVSKDKNIYSTPRRFPNNGEGVAEPTDKLDCFLKVGANVSGVAVLHRDPFVV